MADDQQLTAPTIPEHVTIPTSLIEQWVEIPAGEHLDLSLSRQDIDHLLTGLLRVLEAQTYLDTALTTWSNGQLDQANHQIMLFRQKNVSAQNNVRQFVTAVMVGALRGRRHV